MRHRLAGVAAFLALATASTVQAQFAGEGGEGVRVFQAAYYDEFDPVMAMDLVYRTPGFEPRERDGGRGLSGVRSNILIDGQRPPPKGQSARQQLGQMPVDSVERIELIDAGARLDLDMQGFPQIVNVVTVQDPPAYYEVVTSVRREGTGHERQDNQRNYELEATGSFFWRGHQFTLEGAMEDSGSRSPSGFVNIDPANPEQRITGLNNFDQTEHGVELNAAFALPNESSLTFNGRFAQEDQGSSPIEFDESGIEIGSVSETSDDLEEERDIAAEYRRPLGEGGTLMVAFVDAKSAEQSEESLASGGLIRESFEDSESGETAARLMVTRTPTDQVTLRVTATNAFNFFDGGFRLFENGVELPVEGSDNRVEEDRRSLEGSVDWNLSEPWTLRATVGAEAYDIESRNVSSGVQTDAKGEFSVSFRPRPRTILSLESSRDLGQLGFGQFLASSNLSSEILTAGAAALEPERSWRHTASYDRRFGDVGVLRFELAREEVDNPVRSVALADELIIAQNTSPQIIDSIRASIEFPFERFGREDLILSAETFVSDSETIDPVTGERREVSNITSRWWSFGFRRDPGDGRLAWGVSMSRQTEGDRYSVRRISESEPESEWEAFVEWEPIDDLWIRTNLEGPSTRSRRSLFFGAVRTPGLDPSFISDTLARIDRSASISVQWRRRENFEITGSLSTSPAVREEESLTPFGGALGPILASETETTPQAQIRFRFYR